MLLIERKYSLEWSWIKQGKVPSLPVQLDDAYSDRHEVAGEFSVDNERPFVESRRLYRRVVLDAGEEQRADGVGEHVTREGCCSFALQKQRPLQHIHHRLLVSQQFATVTKQYLLTETHNSYHQYSPFEVYDHRPYRASTIRRAYIFDIIQ